MNVGRAWVFAGWLLLIVACAPVRQMPLAERLSFHGQPDAAAIEQWRADGVDIVINARPDDEMDWDERAVVEATGMRYVAIPISRSGPGFDSDAIEAISQLVEANPDQRIALHCSSGNRVSAWYAIHLANNGMPLPQALAEGQRAGMTSPALAQRVVEYLGD